MEFMLLHTTDKVIEKENWVCQEKMDGVLICAETNGEINLFGRNGTFLNSNFAEIVENLKVNNAVLIGEIICDKFEHTQSRVHNKNKFKAKISREKYPAKFIIFDIVEYKGNDLRNKKYSERLEVLKNIQENEFIEVIKSYQNPYELIELVKKDKGEGVVFKSLDGTYEEGKRSWNNLKYKFWKEKVIRFNSYSINNTGIRLSNENNDACQVSGMQSKEVMRIIDTNKYVEGTIQFLSITDDGRLRMPSWRGIANGT